MTNIDWEATFELIALLSFLVAGCAVLLWYGQYWRPKVRAYKTGANRVAIWFGNGEIILWNPGQTFAFLRNKQLAEVGDKRGGLRRIYAYRGDEAIGPIQLQSSLFNWEDQSVLTRDGQILSLKVGVWWHVHDPEKYVFHIYSDARAGSGITAGATGQGVSGNAGFNSAQIHLVADSWLRVITESAIRAKVNTLTVAEVVSSQAMQFLHHATAATSPEPPQTDAGFETAILSVLGDVQIKAQQFGVEVERLEVQHVHLPKDIQDAINETRIAFLAPIRGEREAEAQRVTLEKLVSVLGKDTVGLNEVMKNLRHANFVTPMSMLQPLFDNASRGAQTVADPSLPSKQLTEN